jgi:hypothetical protein
MAMLAGVFCKKGACKKGVIPRLFGTKNAHLHFNFFQFFS